MHVKSMPDGRQRKKDVEVETLSEWIKSIADVLKRRIRRLKYSVNTRHESIQWPWCCQRTFPSPWESCHSPRRQSIQQLYICLQETLRPHFVRGTWTYLTPWEPYIQSYGFFCIRSAGQPQIGPHFILNRDKWQWARFAIHVLDSKDAQKSRFISGSSKCSTKPLFILLTKLLTHIKQGIQKYCETAYSRSGINQMWILKNSKDLLEHLKSPIFNHVTSIKSFYFSTSTIPHQQLKDILTSITRNAFIFKNSNIRYKIQKNWCTVTVAPTIEHHGGHSRTPANQRWDQVPGRSQRLLLG